jgi:hypothetical protein
MHFPGCNRGNLQLGSFSFYLFKKNICFPPCVACNVVKTLRNSANKNWGIVQLRIRASSSYQSPAILGAERGESFLGNCLGNIIVQNFTILSECPPLSAFVGTNIHHFVCYSA